MSQEVVTDVIINYESQNLDQTVGGIKQTSVALDGLVVASSSTEKSTAALASRFSSLERQLGTAGGNAAQFAKVQKTVNDAVGQNSDLQARGNDVLEAARLKYLATGAAATEAGKAHEGFSTQAQALFHAIRGGVEQIAVGIPITQALTSEMNHLTYAATGPGGISGAFGQLGGFVKNLVSPTTAVIAGIVGITAAAALLANQLDKVQVSSQRAISGAGARTGTTVGDLNSFVSQNSGVSGTGLSNKEARQLGEDLTKTGGIVVDQLHGMSDAVVGFSNQTGKSIAEASKEFVAFGKDPVKGLQELANVFGDFDIATRKAVEEFVRADDKTSAYNVVLDALSEKSKEAAQNMGGLEKATRTVTNALATETGKPVGLEQQLESQRQRVVGAINAPTGAIGGLDEDEKAKAIVRETKAYDDLNAALQKVDATRAKDQVNKLSTDADYADRVLVPQISAIEQLKTKIEELNRAKAAGATSQYGAGVDAAALQAAQNQLQALKESEAEAARYNIEIANIATSWGNVGQSVALQLQTMQNALPVAQAWTEAGRMRAQYEATYLNNLNKGKTAQEATALASKEEELSKASAVASAQKLVQSSQDNLDKIQAQGTGMEGVVASSIAYRDAIQAGATSTQAAAIASNTLQANMLQAAQAADQMAQSASNAASAAFTASAATNGGAAGNYYGGHGGSTGNYSADSGYFAGNSQTITGLYANPGAAYLLQQQAADEAAGIQGLVAAAFAKGGTTAALDAIRNAPNSYGSDLGGTGQNGYNLTAILGPTRSTVADKVSAYDAIVQSQNSQTTDKGVQNSNNLSEIAYLRTLPPDPAVTSKITELTNAINGLTTSTNSLTATNQDLLSPYYTQDPRTSHIGFRSQGMASGGEFVVPGGYSSNDNMIGTIPLASGEIVSVRRPGESSGGGQTFHIVNNISVGGGANVDQFKRTVFQATQNTVRQIRAAS